MFFSFSVGKRYHKQENGFCFCFFRGGGGEFSFSFSKSFDNFNFASFLWSEVSDAAVPYSFIEKLGSVGHRKRLFQHRKQQKTAVLRQRKTRLKIEKHEGGAAAAAAAHDPVGNIAAAFRPRARGVARVRISSFSFHDTRFYFTFRSVCVCDRSPICAICIFFQHALEEVAYARGSHRQLLIVRGTVQLLLLMHNRVQQLWQYSYTPLLFCFVVPRRVQPSLSLSPFSS